MLKIGSRNYILFQFRRSRNGLIYFFPIEIVVFLTSLENKEHTGSNE